MKLFILVMLAIMPMVVIAQITTTTVAPRVIPRTQLVVLAPYLIRPGKPYNVAIRRWGITKIINVTLTISTLQDRRNEISIVPIKVTTTIGTSVSGAFVTLNTASLARGSYTLTVTGDGYTDIRPLTYATKSSALVFQLNKSFFTPEQTVLFRLFAYDSETNAVSTLTCQIDVKDPKGNVIRSYTRVGFTKGKFQDEFQLFSDPPLGVWSLDAQCGQESTYVTFEVVENYKLPAYEAIVSVPPYTPYGQGSVPVQITATYAFGDPVTGTGTFNVLYNGNTIISRQVQIVNGVCSFVLLMADLQALPLTNYYYQYAFTMTDSLLNFPIVIDGDFKVVPDSYIEITGETFYVPNSIYSYSVFVRDIYGAAAAPAGTIVTVTITPINIVQSLTLDSTGRASSTVSTPTSGSLHFTATSPNVYEGYKYAYLPWTGENALITLSVSPKSPKLNTIVTVTAIVKEAVGSFVYAITAKGVLLKSDRIFFATGKKTATFTFTPNFSYVPLTKIIVYYINSKGDFVIGTTEINFLSDLPNYVKFDFSNVVVSPGTNYTFSVDSKCGSTVSLNAIDTRVLQLRSDSVLTKEDVLFPLFGYQTSDNFIHEPNRYYPDYEERFIDCILFPITNIPPPPPPPIERELPPNNNPTSLERQARTNNYLKARRDFSETFCWTDVDTSSVIVSTNTTDCRNKITCKVPESLTKYSVYGVSMSTKYGMGLSEPPSNITTSLPLFVDVDVPYEAKTDETVIIVIVIINRVNQNQTVTVTIPKRSCYTATSLTTYGWTSTTTSYVRNYRATANTNFKVQIPLKYLTIGNCPLTITARSALLSDTIEKMVRIVFNGIPRTITSSAILFVDPNTPFDDATLVCNYPPGTYLNTRVVTATVTGDIFGTTLQNLNNLVKLPEGCCEQNLVKLMPNIAVYKYLEATGQLTPTLQATLINNIVAGVQTELPCQNDDGGFDFTKPPETGGISSTWLTAYVVRTFIQVNDILINTVADTIILPAIAFLQNQQNLDGSFDELGPIVHPGLQGATGQGIALNAYVTETFRYVVNAYPSDIGMYQTYIDSIYYLISQVNLNAVTDVYDRALVTYALKNAGQDPLAQITFDDFYPAKIDIITELKTYWKKTLILSLYWTESLDIEVTSYGLQLMMLYGYQDDAVKVVRWILSQQNSNGGFGTTQSTVVALNALSEFAIVYPSTGSIVDVTLTPNVGPVITNCDVTPANALTLQVFPLDQNADSLYAEGTTSNSGYAIVSLICDFYQDPFKVFQSFDIATQFYRFCKSAIGFDVCVNNKNRGKSGMAIIRVKMPSGFRYERWWGQARNDDVFQTEVSEGGSLVTFYLFSIGNSATCVKVNAYRYSTITQMRGGTITVNDYYDTFYEASAGYNVPALTGSCWA